MKARKILLLTAILLLVLTVFYITADCIRLRHSKLGTKPLITVSEHVAEGRHTFSGIGYSVHYYINTGDTQVVNGISYIEQLGYGAEFRLFDSILLWAWVE